MYIIGITGGVGCGKSTVLAYLESKCSMPVVQADAVARSLQEPGEPVYDEMVRQFGEGIVLADGSLDRSAVADIVFHDAAALQRLNAIVHPAVKEEIKKQITQVRDTGAACFFLEAALLIEDHYDAICEELWYIHADTDVRMKRLQESRGYSREKIEGMLASQCTKEEFTAHCQVVIDNSGAFADTKEQIDAQLKRILHTEAETLPTDVGYPHRIIK